MIRLETRSDSFSFRKEFIECYKNNPILWDRNHPDYSSALKKEIGYNALMDLWEQHNGCGTLHDVKKEINNLRGRYRKELRKITLAEEAGRAYRPVMKLFKMMDFLRGNIKCEREEPSEAEKAFIETLPTIAEYNESFSEYDLSTAEGFYSRCPFPRKLTAEFIECFSRQPCLWDLEHPKYRCIMSRNKATNELLKVLWNFCGSDCSAHDVKRKINSIRTSYARERTKERKCAHYKSKVWWLSLADFLRKPLEKRISGRLPYKHEDYEIEDTITNEDDLLDMPKSGSGENNKNISHYVEESDTNSNYGNTLIEECKDPFEESNDDATTPTFSNSEEVEASQDSQPITIEPGRRQHVDRLPDTRKRVCFSAQDKMLLHAYHRAEREVHRDAFDEMAKIWAEKLRSMPDIQSIFATKAINEIIFQGELERLTFETVQKISSLSQNANTSSQGRSFD